MKLLLLGDSAVGKSSSRELVHPARSSSISCERRVGCLRSSLLMRFCESKFDANFVLTIGQHHVSG